MAEILLDRWVKKDDSIPGLRSETWDTRHFSASAIYDVVGWLRPVSDGGCMRLVRALSGSSHIKGARVTVNYLNFCNLNKMQMRLNCNNENDGAP